jgi:hypothetical protein
MELNKKAYKKLMGATIVKIEDNIIYFDNETMIVLTEEETKCLNNS